MPSIEFWCEHCRLLVADPGHFPSFHPDCEICVTNAGYEYPIDGDNPVELSPPTLTNVVLEAIEATPHVEIPVPDYTRLNKYTGFNPERYFGVEIECVGMSRRVNDALMYTRIPGVDVGSDGSINHYNGRTRRYGGAAEVRLGPWNAYDNGFTNLKRVCDILIHNRVSVNTTCGLHVHHDLDAYGTNDTRKMGSIRNLYTRYSHAIELFLNPSRWDNSYCQSMLEAQPGYGGEYDRYVAVNGVTEHRTVEYRQHQGSVSFTRIKNWIVLTNMLTEYAIKCGGKIGTKAPAAPLKHMWKRLIVSGDELGIECKRYYTREMRRLAKRNLKPTPRMPMTVSELEACKYGTRVQPQMTQLYVL